MLEKRFTTFSGILRIWKQTWLYIPITFLVHFSENMFSVCSSQFFPLPSLHKCLKTTPVSTGFISHIWVVWDQDLQGLQSVKISNILMCCVACCFFIWGWGLSPLSLVLIMITILSQMTFLWKLIPALFIIFPQKHLSSQHSLTTKYISKLQSFTPHYKKDVICYYRIYQY